MITPVAVAGAPVSISFRNAPVSVYWYDDPFTGVSVTVALICVGVPEQSVFGEQAIDTLCTLDPTARSLTSVPPTHWRRSKELPTRT